MLDFGSKFIKAIVFSLVTMFLALLLLFFFVGESMILRLFLPVLLLAFTLLNVILCHVPFLRDHLWIILPIDAVLGIIAAVIVHFI